MLAETLKNVLTANILPLHGPRLYVPSQYDAVRSTTPYSLTPSPCMHSCLKIKICALASSLPP
jgi:hypothetical protein